MRISSLAVSTLLFAPSLAIPAFPFSLLKRQCEAGSQSCGGSACCPSGTHCVQSGSTQSGWDCAPNDNSAGGGQSNGNGGWVYITTTITMTGVQTTVSVYSTWNGAAGGGATPGATPGVTPGA